MQFLKMLYKIIKNWLIPGSSYLVRLCSAFGSASLKLRIEAQLSTSYNESFVQICPAVFKDALTNKLKFIFITKVYFIYISICHNILKAQS